MARNQREREFDIRAEQQLRDGLAEFREQQFREEQRKQMRAQWNIARSFRA